MAIWCEELTHLKRPWCWERLKAGEGDDTGWDGWIASPSQWTWVWVNSRSWWWTGRPGVLWFMGLQRVRNDWVTELNWKRRNISSAHQQIGRDQTSEIKVLQGSSPSRDSSIEFCLFQLLGFQVSPGLQLHPGYLCLHLHIASPLCCVSPLLSLIRMLLAGLRATLTQYLLTSRSLTTSTETLSPDVVLVTCSGGGHIFWGHHSIHFLCIK